MEAAHHISQELLIPVFRMPEFKQNLERINRKLAKLGLNEIQYDVIDTPLIKLQKGIVSPVTTERDDIKTLEQRVFVDTDGPSAAFDQPHYFKANRVQLEGDLPVVGGWRFMGVKSLEHSAPVFRMYEGEPPEAFKTSGATCEHCSTNRRRKELYLLEETATGKWMEVGKSCLSDFTGVDNAERQLLRIQEVYEFFQTGYIDPDDMDRAVGRQSRMEELSTFLAYVAFSASSFGYVTSKQAKAEDIVSTAFHAQLIMYDRHEEYQAMRQALGEDWERYKGIANDAITHWRTTEHDDSTFSENLSTIARDGYFHSEKEAGLAAYLVGAYLRAQQKEVLESQLRNEYLPGVEAGERVTGTTLYTDFIKPVDSYYGLSYLHRFHDDNGYVYTWFGTTEIDRPDGFSAAFTVKAFEEYQGTKQTVITRVENLDAKAQKSLETVRRDILASGEDYGFTIPEDERIQLGVCSDGIEVFIDTQLQRANIRDPHDVETPDWSMGVLLDPPLLKAVRKYAKDANVTLPRRKPLRSELKASIAAADTVVKNFTTTAAPNLTRVENFTTDGSDELQGVKNFTASVQALRQQLKRDLSPSLIDQLEQSGKLVLLARESDLKRGSDASFNASIRAWHGSPHHFQEFDSAHARTGNGEAAFGHGLYFSGSEYVAAGYRASLSKRHETLDGGRIAKLSYYETWIVDGDNVRKADLTPEEAYLLYDVGMLGNSIKSALSSELGFRLTQLDRTDPENIAERDRIAARIETAQALLGRLDYKDNGALYECELAVEHDLLMTWHLPLAEQPADVLDGISLLAHSHPELFDDVVRAALAPDGLPIAQRLKGEDIYLNLADSLCGSRVYAQLIEDGEAESPEQAASLLLSRHGIEGIRHPADMAYAVDGTIPDPNDPAAFNYVIFDDERVSIRHVHSTAENGLQGGYDRITGRMFLIAENLSPRTAASVLLHEGLHASVEQSHVNEWKILSKRLAALYDRTAEAWGDNAFSAAPPSIEAEAYQRVMHAQNNRKPLSRADQIEEFGAYLVELEQSYRAEINVFTRWARDAKGALQHLCLKAFGVQLGTPSAAQLSVMAKAALHSLARDTNNALKQNKDCPDMDLPIDLQSLSKLSIPQISSLILQYRESPLAQHEVNAIVDHVMHHAEPTELLAFYSMTGAGQSRIVERIGAQGSLFQVAWLYNEIDDPAIRESLYESALIRFDQDSLDTMLAMQPAKVSSSATDEELDLDMPFPVHAMAASRSMSN